MIDIPVLSVQGCSLPDAWERAMLAVYDNGIDVSTEYDTPGDPPSKDATVMVTVLDPLADPRIHKNFPGGPTDLEVYRQEVVDGIHDHWIDPKAGKWTYTYHHRLFEFKDAAGNSCNQMQYVVDKLIECFYSRRAQAVTWNQITDPPTSDPPCLQRLWFRMTWVPQISDYAGGFYLLNVNSHWRSRDLYKAWFMNAYAITSLAQYVAHEIENRIGFSVILGRYVDISDSLHIYGSYLSSRNGEHVTEEIEKYRDHNWMERSFSSQTLEPMFQEARVNLAKNPDFYAKGDVE